MSFSTHADTSNEILARVKARGERVKAAANQLKKGGSSEPGFTSIVVACPNHVFRSCRAHNKMLTYPATAIGEVASRIQGHASTSRPTEEMSAGRVGVIIV